jgi:TPP-dependent pyruvate/acetoin dehydrogenase alpha subunit
VTFDYQEAYRLMYLIRRTEEEISSRYRAEELMKCPTHLSIGQESAAVGVMMALEADDHVYSTHRCHAHYLAKGGDVDAMIAELHGKETGCTKGWGGSMHLVDESVGFMGAMPIVGDYSSLAIGSAMAFKMDGSGRVAVAFFGDSAVETGQFWEAANFAALHKLPIMFICENNYYATATHISERQPNTPIHNRVRAFMPSAHVNGDRVQEVWAAATECRKSGPGFLEIETYRYREHVGPDYDWDLGYRTKEEVNEHMSRDSLPKVRESIGNESASLIEERCLEMITGAFERAKAAPWPKSSW